MHFTSGKHALNSAVLFHGGMRIQHFVVFTLALWLTLAVGEAQSPECVSGQVSAVPIRLPHIVALSETGRAIGFWVTMSVTAVGAICILCWLPRGASGWDNVMSRFPDVPIASGGRVKPHAHVGIGGFNFSGSVTLTLTSAGVHVRPQGLLTPQVFIPYSALKRIVVYPASKFSKVTRFAFAVHGVPPRDVYDLVVDYPVDFEIALSCDDFEFVKPFVTDVPMQEHSDE